MTRIPLLLFLLFPLSLFAQNEPTEQAKPIVEEGKRLYRSEMASWYGTDLFMAHYPDKSNIGGYFSYAEGDVTRCIFFSRAELPKVIGTMTFDSTYSTSTAQMDLAERDFTAPEADLFRIRRNALDIIRSDTFFKAYENTDLNLIPLITGDERKVYVLTGPKENNVVIIGNDYLLTFDKQAKLTGRRRLHKNIIPIRYNMDDSSEVEGAIHSHLPETGEFITATDICTLMLYEKPAKWKQHTVVSQHYISIWNCRTDELLVMPMKTMKKIYKDAEKRERKRSRKD